MLAQSPCPFTSKPAIGADDDEGDREQLPLVETYDTEHVKFPWLLHVLEELHEEAETEDACKQPAEEIAGAYFSLVFSIQKDSYGKE